jgi:tetratricopeptide (TPR) repeat protein
MNTELPPAADGESASAQADLSGTAQENGGVDQSISRAKNPPPEAPAQNKPIRTVPIQWILTAALGNLTGLGLGYLFLKRYARWLIHLAITAALLTQAYSFNAARQPWSWIGLIGAWWLWMIVDGALIARRVPPEEDRFEKQVRTRAIVGAALMLIEIAGIAYYQISGAQTFESAMQDFQATNFESALARFTQVTTLYRLTLQPGVLIAEQKIEETETLMQAAEARQKKEFSAAVNIYLAFVKQYPQSEVNRYAQAMTAETYHEWGNDCESQKEFAEAIDKHSIVLEKYAGFVEPASMLGDIAAIYFAWGADLRKGAYFEQAVTEYLALSAGYPQAGVNDQVMREIGATYNEWALKLREAEQYAGAISKYKVIEQEYPQTPAGSDIHKTLATTYTEWASAERRSHAYDSALEKYQILLNNYSTVFATTDVRIWMAETHNEWGAYLRAEKNFSDSVAQYSLTVSQFPETEAARIAEVTIGWVYHDWAKNLYGENHFNAALDKYKKAKEATSDAEIIAAAEAGYEEALWGLALAKTGEGADLIEATKALVCAGKPAESPAINLASKEPGKARTCDTSLSLPETLSAQDPAHFRYTVTTEVGTRDIQRCPYTYIGCGGWYCPTSHILVRQQQWKKLTVRTTITGRIYTVKQFNGGNPEYCPRTYRFGTSYESYLIGSLPDINAIIKWLTGIIK